MDDTIDKKTAESLALLIASKTGIDDNFALVARKVIADYVGAKKIIHEYNETAVRAAKKKTKSPKEKKGDRGKNRKKDGLKASKNAANKAVDE